MLQLHYQCATVISRSLKNSPVQNYLFVTFPFRQAWRGLASVGKDVSQGRLVYQSASKNLVVYAKTFSLFSSVTVLGFQPFLISKLSHPGAYVLSITCGLAFSILTPLLLHLLTRSHVYQLHYNRDTNYFTAYTRGIFLNRRTVRFTPDEVTSCEPGLSLANISVRGTPLFISEVGFLDMDAYKRLLGFDKPIILHKDHR